MSIMRSSAVKGRDLRSGIKERESLACETYRIQARVVSGLLRDFYQSTSDCLGVSILTVTRLKQRRTVMS